MSGSSRHRSSRWLSVVVAAAALASATADARPIEIQKIKRASNERAEEIAFTATARVRGLGPEQLARCVARTDRPVVRGRAADKTFARVRWTDGERDILRSCSAGDCKYEFSRADRNRLASAQTLADKTRLYYELIYNATVKADKKRKDNRIRAYQVARSYDGACARDGGLHWLLNGRVKPYDRLAWRKVHASKRMRPTLMTMQGYGWQAGDSVCVGKTLLFADHYYDDLLELYELRPLANGEIALTYHMRNRFDFFNSWWARRFKGTIASRLAKHATAQLQRTVTRCARNQLVAKN